MVIKLGEYWKLIEIDSIVPMILDPSIKLEVIPNLSEKKNAKSVLTEIFDCYRDQGLIEKSHNDTLQLVTQLPRASAS